MKHNNFRFLVSRLLLLVVTLIVSVSLLLTPLAPSVVQAAPQAPVLISPANGTTTTVVNYPPQAIPVFQWQAVGGATNYRIQFDNDIAFSTVDYEATTAATQYIPNSNGAFSDGVWYWRVRVESPGPPGNYSPIWQFTRGWGSAVNAPTLLSPAAGASVEFFEGPVFSWTPVIGAASYRLRVSSSSPDCSSGVVAEYSTLTTQYNFTDRLVNGTYYWCVIPRDANNRDGQSSSPRQFTVVYAQSPQLLAPANLSAPRYTPQFRWTAVKGANRYRLYWGTTENFAAGTYSTRDVVQTTFTPDISLANDQTTYWKVTALYGSGWEGPPSATWRFTKSWTHRPELLTPRNNELVNVPLFTWTPVREAAYYEIQISFDAGFSSIRWQRTTPNTFLWRHEWDVVDWGVQTFWRVRAFDAANNPGPYSVQKAFTPNCCTTALPEALYPRYYYQPPSIPTGYFAPPDNIPVSYDYTVDTPTFYWSKTFVPGVNPRVEAHHYKLEVSSDPLFMTTDWTYETQNLSATPTDGAPFVPASNTDYYWRVTPYLESGSPLTNSATNEKWMTQIDLARLASPVITTSPPVLRPADGEKMMDTLPSFEWLPQQGAVRYRFEIGDTPGLAATVYATRTVYTHHTPAVRLPKGTYFWRVCGLDGSNAVVGACTTSRRLIQTYQTRWSHLRLYPNSLLTQPAGSDPAGTLIANDADEGLGATELTSLYAAQDRGYWYIGFHVNPVLSGTVRYGIYLDADQVDGSGAATAPASWPQITTASYFRPEYAVYVSYNSTQFNTATVPLYDWNKTLSMWNAPRNLLDPVQIVGGAFTYSQTLNYVELRIPKTAIGDLGSSPFVLSAAAFSASSAAATSTSDTTPNNGSVTSVLTEFKTIGDRAQLSLPADSQVDSPTALPYTPYLYAEVPNTDNLKGFQVQVAQDPDFTQLVEPTMDTTCVNCAPYPDVFQFVYAPVKTFIDKTLYWRYITKHAQYYPDGGETSFSPPSQPHVFAKSGLIPENLQISGTYGTPTFVWDPVEGAAQYDVQVSSNPLFSPVLWERRVNHESFTREDPFASGRYYWRVRGVNNYNAAYSSGWSITQTMDITYPTPAPIGPILGQVVHSTPTFSWQTLLMSDWNASRYRLQVATSPNGFNSPFEEVSLQANTWTPSRGYADRTYYWRIAAVDGYGLYAGPYSEVYSFTKQYPKVTILSPLTGTLSSGFPVFLWTRLDGAARYQVQIAKDPQYAVGLITVWVDNTTYIPTSPMDTANYYWRVAMADNEGNLGPWTDSLLAVNPYPYRVYLPALRK